MSRLGAAARSLTARAAALSVLLLASFSPSAVALPTDDPPVTVSLSDLTPQSGSLVGALTVRSKTAATVDPSSLKASIDGDSAPVTTSATKVPVRRVILLVDTSGSMGAEGMAIVRTASAQYLRDVPSDVQVGVASFANTAGVDLAPTTNRASLTEVIAGLVARGDTSLFEGVTQASAALGPTGDRSIVLLSDGADTVAADRDAALAKATEAVRKGGIRVDVVRFKSPKNRDSAALKTFADIGGGTLVDASDDDGVRTAFAASARALDTQTTVRITAPSITGGKHLVRLSGVASGQPFTIERTVTVGASPAVSTATPAPTATQAGGVPGASVDQPVAANVALTIADRWWIPIVGGSLLALALLVLLAGILAPSLKSKRQRRIEGIEGYVTTAINSRSEHKRVKDPISSQLMLASERLMERRKTSKSTLALIDRADLPIRLGEWFVIRVASVVVVAALLAFLLPVPPLAAVIAGAVIGYIAPPVVLRFLAARRARAFEKVLPDVLALVATSLSSGFGLPQALEAVATDAAQPAAKEFSRAIAETRIGTEIPDALERVANRMDSTALRWTVMAIRIQREVGGNLADTLRTTAHTLREREGRRRQVLTLSAEGRLSAVILLCLPIALFVYLLKVNYDYIDDLWTTKYGILMSIGAVVSMTVGVIWMRRIVKIEV